MDTGISKEGWTCVRTHRKGPLWLPLASDSCLGCGVSCAHSSKQWPKCYHLFFIQPIHSSDVPTVSFISTSNAPVKVSGKGLGTKPNHLLTLLCCGQPQLPSQNNWKKKLPEASRPLGIILPFCNHLWYVWFKIKSDHLRWPSQVPWFVIVLFTVPTLLSSNTSTARRVWS